MKKGDMVNTPRFLKVRIEKVCRNSRTARQQGYVEPTHYHSEDYSILGKNIGDNCMIFAAVRKAAR